MSDEMKRKNRLTLLIGLFTGAIIGGGIYLFSSDILIAGIIVPSYQQGAFIGLACLFVSAIQAIRYGRATSRGNQELGPEVEEPQVSPPRPTKRALDVIEAKKRGVPLKEVMRERLLREMEELEDEDELTHHTVEGLGLRTKVDILEVAEGMGLKITKRTKKALIIERILDQQYLNLSARVESEEDSTELANEMYEEQEGDREVHEALTEKRIKEHLPPELRSIYSALPGDVKFELQTLYVPQMLEHANKVTETRTLAELEGEQYVMPERERLYRHRRKDDDEDIRSELRKPRDGRKLVLRRKKEPVKKKKRKDVRRPRKRLDKHK